MSEEAHQYVQGQIAQASNRLRSHATNPKGENYPQRHLFVKLQKHLNDYTSGKTENRWIVVPGLRGVGKTTILSQLFLKLLAQVDVRRILYVSLDEVTGLLNTNLKEVLDAYESILGEKFEQLQSPVFLFVDEVQYDPKWGLTLKSIYDRTKRVFICCTGSSAVSLQTNPDIHRRIIVEKLYPLSFPEYQMLKSETYPSKGLKLKIKEALYCSKDSKEAHKNLVALQPDVVRYWAPIDRLEIQLYLMYGTLPFALQYTNPHHVYEAINNVLDKIILKDIESLKSFDVQTLHAIKRLLFMLADTSDTLSLAKLPAVVGLDSKITIQRVLSVLEQAELLVRVVPYGSQKSRITKPSKYLFMSPAIRMALLGVVGMEATFRTRMGKLLEDAAALHFTREYIGTGMGNLTFDAVSGGADFVLQIANKKQLVVEVGIGDKGIGQVMKTMERIHADYGIVIGQGQLRHFENENTVYLPLEFFLLL